ncbi:MAG: Flp pilus assembly complex ATPase component TadA [Psychrobacter sp.]|nr:Flp pilus assembly complex ATPase component TadA [Psychrobacter sp.]
MNKLAKDGVGSLQNFKQHHEKIKKKGMPPHIEGSNLRPIKLVTDWQQPESFKTTEDVRSMLAEVREQGASEIFIMPGEPIAIMVDGSMWAITYRVLKLSEAQFLLEVVTHNNAAVTKIAGGDSLNGTTELFEQDKDGDSVKNKRGLKKYNRYRHNAAPCMTPLGSHFQITMRFIPDDPLPYHKLGMVEADVDDFITTEGIVIIAGRTGSGKTTTLAAVIRYILEGDTIIKGNIVTHEEPIEFRYDNILSFHSVVAQSEIGFHFSDFNKANREAMRRYPALILLGELRDSETIMAAVEASQTGHPVFATTHATNVESIIPRMVSRFPDERKSAAAYDIIEAARFFVAQKLVLGTNGKRFAVRSSLRFIPELRKRLLDTISTKGEIAMIKEIRVIMENEEYGAQNFLTQADQLLQEGKIDIKAYNELVS